MKIEKTELKPHEIPRYPIKGRFAFCCTSSTKDLIGDRIDSIVEGEELVCPTIKLLRQNSTTKVVQKLVKAAKKAYPNLKDSQITAHVLQKDTKNAAIFITIPKQKS
jgi:hypothetical protein